MSYMEFRRNHINSGRPLPEKKRYSIPKVSKKRQEKIDKEKQERGDDDTELQRFFKSAIRRMTGYCAETGLKTETKIYQYAVMSIAHLLPKAKCKSVATHPCNWIELNVDFHHKFDAMSWEEREKLGCWPEIRDRLIMVYPNLAKEEQRHFPESVLKYMDKHKPF
jgi:hypothetical protein